jgi:hypothetical protein
VARAWLSRGEWQRRKSQGEGISPEGDFGAASRSTGGQVSIPPEPRSAGPVPAVASRQGYTGGQVSIQPPSTKNVEPVQ